VTALIAKCALGGALGWTVTPGQADERRLLLLSSALEDPDSVGDELRSRLLAAYANELAFSSDLEERVRYSDQAVELARAVGSPALLLSILNQRFNAIWAPETLAVRLRESEEASRIAEAGDHLLAKQIAAGFAMAASVESGDMDSADRHLDRFGSLALQLRLPVFTWGVTLHASWKAVIAGDLEEAENLSEMALRLGTEANRPEVRFVYLSQRVGIRWAQGRIAQECEALRQLCEMTPALAAFRAAYALALFQRGETASAKNLLVGAWRDGSIETLPRDQIYLTGLMHWAELASALREVEISRGLLAMLVAYRDRFCFSGAAVYGPVAHVLGLLAETIGDDSAALEFFDDSLRMSRNMRSPFFAGRSETTRQRVATAVS
jgi:hypothetical protein